MRFILAMLFLLASCIMVGCTPSDSELKNQFHKVLPTLEKIRLMQIEDSNVVRIAPKFTRLVNDWSWPREDIGFSQERWSKYKELFKLANISDGIQKDGDSLFYFVSSSGIVGSGYSKGFVYMLTPPNNFETSSTSCKSDLCFTHLNGKWYLFTWSS